MSSQIIAVENRTDYESQFVTFSACGTTPAPASLVIALIGPHLERNKTSWLPALPLIIKILHFVFIVKFNCFSQKINFIFGLHFNDFHSQNDGKRQSKAEFITKTNKCTGNRTYWQTFSKTRTMVFNFWLASHQRTVVTKKLIKIVLLLVAPGILAHSFSLKGLLLSIVVNFPHFFWGFGVIPAWPRDVEIGALWRPYHLLHNPFLSLKIFMTGCMFGVAAMQQSVFETKSDGFLAVLHNAQRCKDLKSLKRKWVSCMHIQSA